MMYVVWYFDYLFSDVELVIDFFRSLGTTIGSCFDSLVTLIRAFPLWLSVPFISLLSIAVLFRLSQFIPAIGGASN